MTQGKFRRPAAKLPAPPSFAEAPVWRAIGDGWRPLFGSFRDLGFSFEWHDFQAHAPFAWAPSFHPGGIELCLNVSGQATIRHLQQICQLTSQSLTVYRQGEPALTATRAAGDRHRFITVEYSAEFLREHFGSQAESLRPDLRQALRDEPPRSFVADPERLTTTLQAAIETLRHPPVFAPAQAVWFRSKALELAALLFFQPQDGEMFCTRAQRVARERVERAQAILRERMAEPPSLDELGRLVGCSSYYLSRLFSQEAGQTIQQFLRQIRMERAAELLRTGRCNVTEAALEVGYNSLSHFSSAFHETFGCCPGLYPLKTPTQRIDPTR